MERYAKKLCMTELSVGHFSADVPHHRPDPERTSSHFFYVVRGSAKASSMGRSIKAGAGELFFIPEGTYCTLSFSGAPTVEYYEIVIISKKLDRSESASEWAMQTLDALSGDETGARIREIYRLMATDERAMKLQGLGLYYLLYAEILPHLAPALPMNAHYGLRLALAYMDEHFAEDFSMEDMAAACCISTSQLFRLFRNALGITPTRYRNAMRIEHAAEELRASERSVEDIAEQFGFHSAAYFRETFRQYTDLSPSEYRAMPTYK